MIKVICVGGEPCKDVINKCLQSFVGQTCQGWDMAVVLDPADYNIVVNDTRIKITINDSKKSSTENLLTAVEMSDIKDEDIVVFMDGDDWLLDKNSLAVIFDAYNGTNILVTHGSFVCHPLKATEGFKGLNTSYTRDDFKKIRRVKWRGSQLRTMKYKVFKLIKDSEFRDENGEYFKGGCDQAFMFPALEMAGFNRTKHITPPVYVYNVSGIRTSDTHKKYVGPFVRCVKSRKPYTRLP